MTIKREDIDSRRVDFSDIATGRRLPPTHPGEILWGEFLEPMGLSVYELAKAIKVPAPGPTMLFVGDVRFRRIRHCALVDISRRRPNSGSTCKPATILMLPSVPCARKLKKRFPLTRLDKQFAPPLSTEMAVAQGSG